MKPYNLLAQTRTPDGSLLALYEHDSAYHLKLNGHALMSTTATASEAVLAELVCGHYARYQKPRVLIGGLGFGFSLKRTLELINPQSKVEVAELLPEVVAWNREFLAPVNGLLLKDPRVKIFTEDVFNIIGRAPEAHYDAIMLDVDNGPVAMVQGGNDRLYDRNGIDLIMHALKPGGRVAFWSASMDKPFEKRLKKAGYDVLVQGAKAYEQAKKFSHTIYVVERPLPKIDPKKAKAAVEVKPAPLRPQKAQKFPRRGSAS